MTKYAKVFMSNGSSYQLGVTPKEVYEILTHSDGKPLDHIHPFETTKGETIYLHAAHVSSIIEYKSVVEDEQNHEDSSSISGEKRKQHNKETMKNFKKDIDDNME